MLPEPSAAQLPASAATTGCNIFTLWEYPDRVPLFAQLNVDSWRKHSHGLCSEPILINNSNVKRYIPDMPDEYWRLPYDACKSDMIRYALLFHNGGIYMDADFLVARDLTDLVLRIKDYDLVSYEVPGQSCNVHGSFSSNFMTGRKGSRVHKAIWLAQKAALVGHCHEREMKLEKVCCLDDPKVLCHIPWTQLGEGISHRVLRGMLRGQSKNRTMKLFCFKGTESFVPKDMGLVFEKMPALQDAVDFWKSRGEADPLERIAYHLFNSNSGVSQMNRKQLFDKKTLIGTLYFKALSGGRSRGPSSLQLLAAEAGTDELASRLDAALLPNILPKECGGLEGTSREPLAWCRAVLEGALRAPTQDATAIAYGVAPRDPRPSRVAGAETMRLQLIDCRRPPPASQSQEGLGDSIAQQACLGGAEQLSAGLATRPPSGTLLRIDARGSEWAALGALRDEKLERLDLLDLEVYLCNGLPLLVSERAAALEERIRLLERLRNKFGVVARRPSGGARFRSVLGPLCGASRGGTFGSYPKSVGISYVNLVRFGQARAITSQLADRIERATHPTVSAEACRGMDQAASNGDGALHVWCMRILDRALGEKAATDLVGLSYGISTWDSWSRRLADVYKIQTVLYDCYETPSNAGRTPSLEGYAVPAKREDVCVDGRQRVDDQGRRFETLASHLRARGPRGTLVKLDVEGSEWAALDGVPDEALRKVDLLDLQVYLCNRLPGGEPQTQALRKRVAVLERLSRLFHVAARAPAEDEKFRGRADADLCAGGGRYPDTISVSYASRARLAELA